MANAKIFEKIGAEKSIIKSIFRTNSIFSYYLHGRYPELMDMIGGSSTSIHMNGMKGTPKDTENGEVIDDILRTVEICIANSLIRLGYLSHLNIRKETKIWIYKILKPK